MLGFEFRETGKEILGGIFFLKKNAGVGKRTLLTNSVVVNLINTLYSGIGLASL